MMKRIILCMISAMMVIGLAACTPTTQKQMPSTEATVDPKEDKVPDTNAIPMEIVSIFHYTDDRTGIKKSLDAIEGEALDAQKIVDKLSEYGVLEADTKVLAFAMKDGIITLDLSGVPELEGDEEEIMLISIGNTFLENYIDEEVTSVKLLVNGADYAGGSVTHQAEDYLTMYNGYKNYGK